MREELVQPSQRYTRRPLFSTELWERLFNCMYFIQIIFFDMVELVPLAAFTSKKYLSVPSVTPRERTHTCIWIDPLLLTSTHFILHKPDICQILTPVGNFYVLAYTVCSCCAQGGTGAVAMNYVVLFSCFPLHSIFGSSGTKPGQKLRGSIVFKIDASLWKEVKILEIHFAYNVWKSNITLSWPLSFMQI